MAKRTDTEERDGNVIAADVVKTLAKARALYDKADRLIDELRDSGARHGSRFRVGQTDYRLTDNFRGVRKAFRPAVFLKWTLEKVKPNKR